MFRVFISIISAYLIGSIPTAYIAGKINRGIDIRDFGSGNVGATNTLRVLGKKMGILVLIIDMLKGAFCVLILPDIFYNSQMNIDISVLKAALAGFAICGHIWTVFLKFKGGKGVATTCGAILALSLKPALLALGLFILCVYISKYVSLSSIIMMAGVILFMLLYNQPISYVILSIILFFIICYTHRTNIKRLIIGTENKINNKRD